MVSEVELNDKNTKTTVPIIRSQRKSIGIEIRLDGTVVIRVPNQMTDKEIQSFVEQKKDWIAKNLTQIKERESKSPPIVAHNLYYHGAKLPFVDSVLLLCIVKTGEEGRVRIQWEKESSGQIKLELFTLSEEVAVIRDAVVHFYRYYAKTFLTEKTIAYETIMGVKACRIVIKEQKTRWGSCSSKNNINYNWKLLLMPERILEYVVVHELAHLIHMNHSPEFWEEVGKVLPDYRERKEWLNQHGRDYEGY